MKIKLVLSLKKEKHINDLGIPGRGRKTLDGLKIMNYMNSLLVHFDLSMQRNHFILKNILMLK